MVTYSISQIIAGASNKSEAVGQANSLKRMLAEDPAGTLDEAFAEWMSQNGVSYGAAEATVRKPIFAENLDNFIERNSDMNHGEWLSLNGFSAQTFDEFSVRLMDPELFAARRMVLDAAADERAASDYAGAGRRLLGDVPKEWDWRAQGKVTPIKDQGSCGSCWAFAATAIIESGYLIKGHPLACAHYAHPTIDLAEQQMVNCVVGSHG